MFMTRILAFIVLIVIMSYTQTISAQTYCLHAGDTALTRNDGTLNGVAAWSPDDDRVLFGTDQRVLSFDPDDLQTKCVFLDQPVHDLAFSPDGHFLASALQREPGGLLIHDMQNLAAEPLLLDVPATVVAWSPDQTMIAVGHEARVTLIAAGTNETIIAFDLYTVEDYMTPFFLDITFAPDSRALIMRWRRVEDYGNHGGDFERKQVWLIDDTFTPDDLMNADFEPTISLTSNPEIGRRPYVITTTIQDNRIATLAGSEKYSRYQKHLIVLDYVTEQFFGFEVIATSYLNGFSYAPPPSLVFSPDGSRLAFYGQISDTRTGDVTRVSVERVYESESWQVVTDYTGRLTTTGGEGENGFDIRVESPIQSVVLGTTDNGGGRSFVTFDAQDHVTLWDSVTAESAALGDYRQTAFVQFSSNARLLRTANNVRDNHQLWNVERMEPVALPTCLEEPDDIHFLADSRAVIYKGDFMSIWQPLSREEVLIHIPYREGEDYEHVQYSPSGRHLVIVEAYNTAFRDDVNPYAALVVYDTTTGAEVARTPIIVPTWLNSLNTVFDADETTMSYRLEWDTFFLRSEAFLDYPSEETGTLPLNDPSALSTPDAPLDECDRG